MNELGICGETLKSTPRTTDSRHPYRWLRNWSKVWNDTP